MKWKGVKSIIQIVTNSYSNNTVLTLIVATAATLLSAKLSSLVLGTIILNLLF